MSRGPVETALLAACKAARIAAGHSQAELGRRIGRQSSTICRWESGEMSITLDDAVKIGDACGVSLASLLGSAGLAQGPSRPVGHPAAADLRALRRSRGLTQVQVAKLIGIPTSTLAARENGENEPTWTDLQEWAAALGFEVVLGFRPVPA